MPNLQALDTSAIIALIHPSPEKRNAYLNKIDPTIEIVIPFIAKSEAWYGLSRGNPNRTQLKRQLFKETIEPLRVLFPNTETYDQLNQLTWQLCRAGTPINHNDFWIAALCRQHDALLYTTDYDFHLIPDLQVVIL